MNVIERLNEFADVARETSGASFTITKKKEGTWQVSFTALSRVFIEDNIEDAIINARKFLVENRKVVEVETKYTLYGIR